MSAEQEQKFVQHRLVTYEEFKVVGSWPYKSLRSYPRFVFLSFFIYLVLFMGFFLALFGQLNKHDLNIKQFFKIIFHYENRVLLFPTWWNYKRLQHLHLVEDLQQ